MSATQQTPNLGLPKFKGSDITSWLGDFNGAMEILDRLINIIYPVGSYYETNDASFNPNTAWKGTTWVEDTSGTMLVSRTDNGSFTNVGATGGEEKHTLTVNELPSHTHAFRAVRDVIGTNSNGSLPKANNAEGANTGWSPYVGDSNNFAIQNSGGGQPHNNMPPYTVVKRWRRTA